jgi:hypothetical protein
VDHDLALTFSALYIDDVLIHGRDIESFLANVRKVFERLREFNIAVNPAKTKLGLAEVEYVGHVVSATGTSFTEHIPGSMNILFDGLSRNVSPEDLGLDPLLMFQTAGDEAVSQFIKLCNPTDQLSDMRSHTNLLRQCTNLLLL